MSVHSSSIHNNLPKEVNNPNIHQIDKWINKMRYSHTMEYYSAIERNEKIHGTTSMNLGNIMLSEKWQTQKAMLLFDSNHNKY